MRASTNKLKNVVDSLQLALEIYGNNKNESLEMRKVFRDACIQRFEYSIELSWKVSMKVLGSTTAAAKPAVREMARNNLITDAEMWLRFIECRNNTSHAYEEEVAASVFSVIQDFSGAAYSLIQRLEKIK